MKTGFAVSTLLSGIVFAVLSTSMGGCHRSLIVDRNGTLVDPGSVNAPPGTAKAAYSWEQHLHPFESLRTRVMPGDRIEYDETSWSIPYVVAVSRQTIVITRDDREFLREKSGHTMFWVTMAGVSLIPLAVWTVIAVWTATVSPRPQKLESP